MAAASSTAAAAAAVPPAPGRGWLRPSVIPGFGLALGITVTWLSLVVLVPLSALFIRAGTLGPAGLWRVATDERVLAALELSFGAALIASAANLVMGTIVAWALVRYDFPLKRVFDAIVDLPFALPTAVAGIALASLYAPNGWVGRWLEPLGVQVAFTRLGVVVALAFVGLPFIVRTVQPVLQDLEHEVEEAAATLGASRLQTFRRVILPAILPALLTGFALALARAVGEYGSVIFIAGNLPYLSEIAPLLIIIRLEEFDYGGATAVGVLMLVIAFAALLLINLLQAWSRRHAAKS